MGKLLRVTHSGPFKVILIEASNDMSHFTPSHYSLDDWHYMTEESYKEKIMFESFNMKPKLSPEEVKKTVDITLSTQDFNEKDHPWAYRCAALIRKAGGYQLWQYDSPSKDLKGLIRNISALGVRTLHQVSWFDCFVTRPILQLKRDRLNRSIRERQYKEIKEWDLYLETVYKENK